MSEKPGSTSGTMYMVSGTLIIVTQEVESHDNHDNHMTRGGIT